MLLLISYEPAPGQPDRTDRLVGLIGEHGSGSIEPSKNRWIIETDDLPSVWAERFEGPGRLFMCRVQSPGIGGFLPRDMWAWIDERIEK